MHMNKLSLKRGKIVQDIDGHIYMVVKKAGNTTHVLLLDENGYPTALTSVETDSLRELHNIPPNFNSIDITL